MAKKKDDDRAFTSVDADYFVVHSVVIAEATHKATEVWNVVREFREDTKRELTEREVIHLRALLYMVKETFEEISIIAQKYNAAHVKEIKKLSIVPFRTGAIDVQDSDPKAI